MPTITRDGATIYYEEFGSGYPILTFAGGSLNSVIGVWHGSPFDPISELPKDYRVIAMDQRNAGGRSWGPITADDGWHTYTNDHIAVLDHLGIDRCHIMGMCIGGPFCMAMLRAQPQRISAAVLLQPSGRIGPDTGRPSGFDRWREKLTGHPEATPAVLDSMRRNMYTNDFTYTVPREFVPTCQAPMLVLAGNDDAHPFGIAEEIARLAPRAEFIPEWKTGAALAAAIPRIHEFLAANTPVSVAAR